MSDAIDQGLDDAEMEDESDQIYGQVCEELGLEYGEGDQKAREGKIGVGEQQKQGAEMDDLQSRLDQLKK